MPPLTPPPDNLSDRDLKWGYWYVTHFTKLTKIAWWLLLIMTVLVWLYVIVGLVNYWRETPRFNAALKTSVTAPIVPPEVKAAQAARPLQVLGVYAVPAAAGTVDLVALIENPNQHWYVPNLSYQFTLNGEVVGAEQTFLLPGEKRALLRLKVPGGSGVADIVLYPNWQRLRPSVAYNPPQFTPSTVQFIPAHTPLTDRPAVPFSQAIFLLTNDSPFGWWSVPVVVIGRSASGGVALANEVVVEKFLSHEKRLLTVSWSEPIGSPSTFEIFPVVDTLDSASYLPATTEAAL